MSNNLFVSLTDAPAPSAWGDTNTLSANAEGFSIHLTTSESAEQYKLIQASARKIQSQGINAVTLSGNWSTEQQWHFYQGFVSSKGEQSVEWTGDDIHELNNRKIAFDWTRKAINLPPQDMYPLALANMATEFLEELAPNQIKHEIIMGDDLVKKGWAGIHAVGRASIHPPVMLSLDYNPTGDDNAPISAALVGKGITFDSGGYSIKPSEGMVSMKCDMGGAATVTGALALAILRGVNKRVRLILCCAENLIAGNAYKLGDVITYKNGTTVEIVNTDAEGRLVLADGLMHAEELGAQKIIDAATLTGAAMVAVGSDYNALFALDSTMIDKAKAAAEMEFEGVWPLPLEKFHRNNCPSPYADTANSRAQKGGGMGGASNAAGFLSRFVNEEGANWLHVDLAAAFNNSATDKFGPGATGMGVRTIARLIAED